ATRDRTSEPLELARITNHHHHSTMSTDTNEIPLTDPQEAEAERTGRIRELNDALRTAPGLIGPLIANGSLVITYGVAALGNEFIDRAVSAVRRYRDFGPDNDPYGSTTSAPSSSTARRSTGRLTTTTPSWSAARRTRLTDRNAAGPHHSASRRVLA